ncbi:MAG: trehalose-phosphatase [Erythrobacter sp.]
MGIATGLQIPPSLGALEAAGAISLFLDFDGTLVEIAAGPDAIMVPPTLPTGLAQLDERMERRFALVSGRALDDIATHLGELPIAKAGSHGSDCRQADGVIIGDNAQPLDPSITRQLSEFAQQQGLDFERKSHGAALHFRSKPELEERAMRFATRLAEAHNLDIKTGKCVAELVAKGAGKGQAVLAFMKTSPFAGSQPWFIGDDVTDEDGFAACAQLGGGGILVGHRDKTAAKYALPDVAGVYEWLGL